MNKFLKENYGIEDDVISICAKADELIKDNFKYIDDVCEYNTMKVLKAFHDNNISEAHFASTTGYGYDDLGRDTLDKVYAQVFDAEDAIVRHNIVNGTQAIASCLYGILRPGDTVVAVTGAPYDTLEEVIGIRGENSGSLKEFGVKYKQVDLRDGKPDFDEIKKVVSEGCRMVMLQRSKGYSWRNSFTVDELGEIISLVKSIDKNIICMVDNCYGEFVEKKEPTSVGADIIVGSLIKNPGGGLAKSGGYIAGKKECVELVSYRLTCPGIGRECGASLGNNRDMYQGFFMAPHIVSQSIKASVFCSAVFELMGYEVSPKYSEIRTDIIESIKFCNPDKLVAFCQGIQKGAPIDSFVVPMPWDMPGYENQVIMAAGAFVSGSSIEISADGPMREPYVAYYQGGLTYESARLAIMIAANNVMNLK